MQRNKCPETEQPEEVGDEATIEDITAGEEDGAEAVEVKDPLVNPPVEGTKRRYRRCAACYKNAGERRLAMKVSGKQFFYFLMPKLNILLKFLPVLVAGQ